MTVRRSIDPCPASSRPQRLFATASGTGGPPTQRRWRAIRGTSCSRAPGRAGRDELRRGPARRALRLARRRDDGERRTGKGGGGQDRQRAPSSSSPAWHPISRVGWAFACVLPAPPLSFLAGTAPPSLQCGRRLSLGQWVRTRQPRPGTWTPGRPGSVLLAPCVRGFARRYHLNRWAAHIRQRACASLTLCTR